jgi:biotin synthase
MDLLETLSTLTAKALSSQRPTYDEALAVLRSEDDDLMDVIAAAFRVRRFYFAKRVKLNFLINLKSGLCPEDCFYCSQRRGSGAGILKYSWLGPEDAAAVARTGISGGARRVCLVASGRGPSDRDIDRVTAVIGAIKAEHPEVEVCACLGLLSDGQAARLRAAGAYAYNHNLNTAGQRYSEICTTHTYADRIDTVSLGCEIRVLALAMQGILGHTGSQTSFLAVE